MWRGGFGLALVAAVALSGCGGGATTVVETQTVTATGPPATSAATPLPKPKPKAHPKHAPAAAPNNPAKQPDPQAGPGPTANPANPNQYRQRNCDSNVVANSVVSCPLAENIFYEYYQSPQTSSGETIVVHSPTTGNDYSIFCSLNQGLIGCTGSPLSTGIYASFPQNAIDAYTPDQATAYARSHDLGNPQPAAPAPSPPPSTAPSNPAPSSTGADFCSTHSCIPNFPNGTGYIVQCADGEWSHSGGNSGACSDHGGETAITYP